MKQWNMSGDLWTVLLAGLHFGPSWGGVSFFLGKNGHGWLLLQKQASAQCGNLHPNKEREMLQSSWPHFVSRFCYACYFIILGLKNGGSTSGLPVKGKVASWPSPLLVISGVCNRNRTQPMDAEVGSAPLVLFIFFKHSRKETWGESWKSCTVSLL